MSDFNLIVSSLVLAILLPVSVAVLYALMASQIQLAPESAMHSAVVERFDSESERAEYHAAIEAERQLRRAAVMTRYRQEMERQLDQMDPRQAEPYRQALAASTTSAPDADATAAAAQDESYVEATTPPEVTPAATTASGSTRRRPVLWRAHLTAQHQ